MPHEEFNRELAAAAREMQDEKSAKETMERAVELVVTRVLPKC